MEYDVAFWISIVNLAFWAVCFWFMRRIAINQDSLLREMREQNERIEKLSREEHDLIEEVHPQVGEIKERVEKVANAVDDS